MGGLDSFEDGHRDAIEVILTGGRLGHQDKTVKCGIG